MQGRTHEKRERNKKRLERGNEKRKGGHLHLPDSHSSEHGRHRAFFSDRERQDNFTVDACAFDVIRSPNRGDLLLCVVLLIVFRLLLVHWFLFIQLGMAMLHPNPLCQMCSWPPFAPISFNSCTRT